MTPKPSSPSVPFQHTGDVYSSNESATSSKKSSATVLTKTDSTSKIISRMGACRVCLKLLKADEFFRICFECAQRVCDDCASYSKSNENDDNSKWCCSVCRRRMQSRVFVPQESTDSLLDIPIADPIQRRHSDIKMSTTTINRDSQELSLELPRNPELRRHSDVSPSSFKDLEKLKVNKKSTTDLSSWSHKNISDSRPSVCDYREGDMNFYEVSVAAAAAAGLPMDRTRSGSRSVLRQRSYDNEVKASSSVTSIIHQDQSLKLLPSAMPRRASAYDVSSSGLVQSPFKFDESSSGTAIRSRRSSVRSSCATPIMLDDNDNIVRTSEGNLQLAGAAGIVAACDEDKRKMRRASFIPEMVSSSRAFQKTPWSSAALEELEAPKRQLSVDAEAIKIIIHDVDSAQAQTARKRIVLRRDPNDQKHRTRGFGMRVVGGKTGIDGRLFAYIVWTVPNGPAEKCGLQQGDKILEWGGISLVDKSFEDVCSIMDHTGDTVDLLVEHVSDYRMCDLFDENPVPVPIPNPNQSLPTTSNTQNQPISRRSSEACLPNLQSEYDDKPQSSSTPARRKLPKTPDQISSNSSNSNNRSNIKQFTGRIQIQIWYNEEKHELVVAILAADDLMLRDNSLGLGYLPEAYATLRLIPITSDFHNFQTSVAPANRSPIWNSNFVFQAVPGDELMKKSLEIMLWDLCPHFQPVFLGGTIIQLKYAFFDDRTVWYRLEDLNQLTSKIKSPFSSPRNSIGDISNVKLRKKELSKCKSYSNDSIGDASTLLHPDQAFNISNSRRGSSQSEYLEAEFYQLTKDFSRSLPGSRRSSFQSINQEIIEDAVIKNYSKDRRRSSSITRNIRDPEEILRSLKEVRTELNRSLTQSDSFYNQFENNDDPETNNCFSLTNLKCRRRSRYNKKR